MGSSRAWQVAWVATTLLVAEVSIARAADDVVAGDKRETFKKDAKAPGIVHVYGPSPLGKSLQTTLAGPEVLGRDGSVAGQVVAFLEDVTLSQSSTQAAAGGVFVDVFIVPTATSGAIPEGYKRGYLGSISQFPDHPMTATSFVFDVDDDAFTDAQLKLLGSHEKGAFGGAGDKRNITVARAGLKGKTTFAIVLSARNGDVTIKGVSLFAGLPETLIEKLAPKKTNLTHLAPRAGTVRTAVYLRDEDLAHVTVSCDGAAVIDPQPVAALDGLFEFGCDGILTVTQRTAH